MERENAVTFMGAPLTLIGQERKVGDAAPDAELLKNDLSTMKLSECRGKVCIISAVPSLDTPVCELQTVHFNKEVESLGDNVCLSTVSMDLPFAQGRFCEANNTKNGVILSDHRTGEFGEAYGVLIKGLRLLSRSVFVVDQSGKLAYVQYVKEITEQPDYDSAFKAVKELL